MTLKASLWQIFGVFAKIGAFTIGGGYAMIPIIEDEMLRRHWIEKEEIEDVVVLAQSAPGILAVNMAIFAGYKLRGTKGSLAATIGAVLPSFFIILLIAMFLTGFKDNPIVMKVFKAVRPVAVALILVPAVRMAKSGCKTWLAWLIMAASLFAVALFRISPIWILLVLIVCSASVYALIEKKK